MFNQLTILTALTLFAASSGMAVAKAVPTPSPTKAAASPSPSPTKSAPSPLPSLSPTSSPTKLAPSPSPAASGWVWKTPGPSNPLALKPSGTIVVTKDGTIIQDVTVTGQIQISANNVTVKNFKIKSASGTYALDVKSGTNILIQDGEIDGGKKNSALVHGGNFQMKRVDLHDSAGDGIKPSGSVSVSDCWIHELGAGVGAHADGTQIMSGSHFLYTHNWFDMPITEPAPYKSNTSFIVQSHDGPVSDLVVDGNFMNGGNFTNQVVNSGHGNPTGVVFKNNFFGRGYRYGLKRFQGNVGWTNNRWIDTGALIP